MWPFSSQVQGQGPGRPGTRQGCRWAPGLVERRTAAPQPRAVSKGMDQGFKACFLAEILKIVLGSSPGPDGSLQHQEACTSPSTP